MDPRNTPCGPAPTVIAFHLPHFNAGGIERVVLNLLVHLDRGGFRPVLILGDRTGTLLERVPADVEVRDLGGRRASRAVFELARQVSACGARILYSGTNAANLTALLAGELLRRRPAVVPSEHTPPGLFLDGARFRGPRIAAMRLLYGRAACVAVPLAEIGRELREILNLPDLPIAVQPNPVLTEDFESLALMDPEIPLPPPGTPLITATGRLDPAKGFDVLLQAMALLSPRTPPPHLVIMGAGPQLKALQALTAELGLADRVTLAGHVGNPYAVMRRADLAVMSSRREGFGNVLIEAMACGVPVVAADCPVGPRVILQGGDCGLLVPPEDPAALAQAMDRVLGDKPLAGRLAAAGRKRAQEYTVSRTVRVFQEQFAELACGRP